MFVGFAGRWVVGPLVSRQADVGKGVVFVEVGERVVALSGVG